MSASDRVVLAILASAAACGGAPPSHVPASASQQPAADQFRHGAHTGPAASVGHGGHHGHTPSHRFDDAEAWAKVFDDPARDAWQRPAEVVALLDVRPGATVADLGAGTGYFLPYLSHAVGPTGRVIATDIEPAMVEHIRQRAARDQLANVTTVQVAPDDPGLPAAGVDRVLIVDVWHHLDDRPSYARKLAAALRPRGVIAVVDFTLDSAHGPPRHHRVTADAVIADLTAAGLAARIADEALPEQYVVLASRSSP